MIRFLCSGCDKLLSAPANQAGAQGRCPKCRSKFLIPGEPPPNSMNSVFTGEVFLADEEPRRLPPSSRQPPMLTTFDAPPPIPRASRVPARQPRESDFEVIEDDDDEPRRRRSSSRYDKFAARRRPRRRRSPREEPESFNWLLWLYIVTGALGMIFTLGELMVPHSFITPLICVGGGVMMFAQAWLFVTIGREDPGALIAYFFVPFYALVYLLQNFDTVKHPFLLNIWGFLIIMPVIMFKIVTER